jgi:hypothetical protein
MTKPRKKSNWMKGFVIPPPTHPADKCRIDGIARVNDVKSKMIKRGKS